MGQASARGTLEERIAQSVARKQIEAEQRRISDIAKREAERMRITALPAAERARIALSVHRSREAQNVINAVMAVAVGALGRSGRVR